MVVRPRRTATASSANTSTEMLVERPKKDSSKNTDSAATVTSLHKKTKAGSESAETTLSRYSLQELAAKMKEALAMREKEQELAQERQQQRQQVGQVSNSTTARNDSKKHAVGSSASYRQRVKTADDALDLLKAQLKDNIRAVTSPADSNAMRREPTWISSTVHRSSSGGVDQRDDVEIDETTRGKDAKDDSRSMSSEETPCRVNNSTKTCPAKITGDPTKATTTTNPSNIYSSLQNCRNKEQELRLKAEEKIAKLYSKMGDMDRKLASAEEVARKERNLKRISDKKVAKLEKSERRLTLQLQQAQQAKNHVETKLLAMMDKMSQVDDKLASTEEKLSQALQRHAQDVKDKQRQASEIKTLRLQLQVAEQKVSKAQKGLELVRAENENSTQCIQMLRKQLEEKEQELAANAKKLQEKDETYRKDLSHLQKTDYNIAVLQQRLEEKRHQIEALKQSQRTEQLSLTTNSLQNKYLMSSLEKAKLEFRKESTRRLQAEEELRLLRASHTMASSVAPSHALSTIDCPAGLRVNNNKKKANGTHCLSNRSNISTTSVESWTSGSHTNTGNPRHSTGGDDASSIAESASAVLSEMEELFSRQGSPRHGALVSSLKNASGTTNQRHFFEKAASVGSNQHSSEGDTQMPDTMEVIIVGEPAGNTEILCTVSKEIEHNAEIDSTSHSRKTSTLGSNQKKPILHVETTAPLDVLAPPEQANESDAQKCLQGGEEKRELAKRYDTSNGSCVYPQNSSKSQASKTSTMKMRALELLSPSHAVPVHIRDMFQRVGFYKDRKNRNQYIPVLCLAAYSMPPGPAQDEVMRSSDEKVGVYLYGCSAVGSAYQAIKWFRFIPYETGVGRGHLELPQHIDAKKRNKTPLSNADHDICHGLVVIQREATKPHSERMHPCEPRQQQTEDTTPRVESINPCGAGVPTKAATKEDAIVPYDGFGRTKQIASIDLEILEARAETYNAADKEKKNVDVAENFVAGNFETSAAALVKPSSVLTTAGQVMNAFKQCLVPECADTTGLLDMPTGLEGGLYKPTIKEVIEMTRNVSDKSRSDEKHMQSFTKTHQHFSAALQKLARETISVNAPSAPSKPQQEHIRTERERDIPEFIVGVGTDSVSEMGDFYFEIAPKPYDADSGYCVDQLQQILGRDYQDNMERLRCEQRKPPCVEETSCFPSFPSDESGPKNFCL